MAETNYEFAEAIRETVQAHLRQVVDAKALREAREREFYWSKKGQAMGTVLCRKFRDDFDVIHEAIWSHISDHLDFEEMADEILRAAPALAKPGDQVLMDGQWFVVESSDGMEATCRDKTGDEHVIEWESIEEVEAA